VTSHRAQARSYDSAAGWADPGLLMRQKFRQHPYLVIPVKAGLRRQDAGANNGEAVGLEGALQERRVIQCLEPVRRKALGPRLRGDDEP
jgi:hypothetical protein